MFLRNIFKLFFLATGSELKRIREASNLSANSLAKLLDVSSDRLRKWEQRDIDPKHEDQIKIEKFFNIELSELGKIKRVPVFPNKSNTLNDDSALDNQTKDEIIRALNETIEAQKKTIDLLEEKLTKQLGSNFQKVLENQEDIMVQIRGGHLYLADHFSGGDPKKLAEEKRKINKSIGVSRG